MMLFLARSIGRSLRKWKRRMDRQGHGIWIGPPPELLAESDLLCGDVLFCGDRSGRKPSRMIQSASSGGYVHCGLYIGHGIVVDAIPGGVQKTPLEEFIDKYSYLAVARCPGNECFRTRRKVIRQFALTCLKGRRGYNYLGAAISPLKELSDLKNLERFWERSRNRKEPRTIRSKRSFCSEFILEAYVASGYIRQDDIFLSPSRRTPSGLAEEGIFDFLGYMSSDGLAAVSGEDHFLGAVAGFSQMKEDVGLWNDNKICWLT